MGIAGLAESSHGARPLLGVRPKDLDALVITLSAAQAEAVRLQSFNAEAGTLLLLPGEEGAALVGLGRGPILHGFGAAPAKLPSSTTWRLEAEDIEAATLGFLLGAYRFDHLKTGRKPPLAQLDPAQASPRIRAQVQAITLARDLINTPANLLGPRELADAAESVGLRLGAAITRINGTALSERYPAMAAVGAGSERGPEAITLHWQGSTAPLDAPLISLCGKGVCFDTGGYDLKPSAAMLRMKKDMGGAAIMLGLAEAIMALDLPIRLQLRLGCVENSISGHAMRPSDVLKTFAGLTVEVGNTDAEGRLVLCDLLADAAADSPDWLIDAATLTGAARVALGPDLPALFCTSDEMSETILASGRIVDDPLWRLPLFSDYDAWLDSPVADLATVAAKPMAGSIIAALFLQRFVTQKTAWAHIDVYAWNDSNRPGRPEGGEAQTLRALLHAIETRCGTIG